MQTKLKTKMVAGAVGLTALAGAGGTYAATSDKPDPAAEHKAEIADAAKRLNVSSSELEAALKGARDDRLDAAVKAGRLTAEQAAEMKKNPGPRGGGPGGLKHRGAPPGEKAAAEYLGLSEAELRAERQDGKSLADVAKAKGKSVDGLKDAIAAAEKANADEHVDDIVNRKGGGGPGGPPPAAGQDGQ